MSILGPALLEALEPLGAPPACSGQPLAHTLIGHASDGGDLKETAEQRASMPGSLGDGGAQLTEDHPQSQPGVEMTQLHRFSGPVFQVANTNHCTDSM